MRSSSLAVVMLAALGLASWVLAAQPWPPPDRRPDNKIPDWSQPATTPGWNFARINCGRNENGYTYRMCLDCCFGQYPGGPNLGACNAQCASRPLPGNPGLLPRGPR